MADKRIIELEERTTISENDYFATDNTNGTCKVNAKILLDRFDDDEDDIATRAKKVDLTNISTTGSTNNSGATITSGTYFYKDGTLARAKTDIANGATLTLNTNYEIVTAGGLNSLNEALIYSTSEINTGQKWIDGSDIYRKVYSIPTLPSSESNTIDTITNFNRLLYCVGSQYYDDSNANVHEYYHFPYQGGSNSANDYARIIITNDGSVKLLLGSVWRGNTRIKNMYIIVYYTKI